MQTEEVFNTKAFVQKVADYALENYGCDHVSPILALSYLATQPEIIHAFEAENKNVKGLKIILDGAIYSEKDSRETYLTSSQGNNPYNDSTEVLVKDSLASDELKQEGAGLDKPNLLGLCDGEKTLQNRGLQAKQAA